VTEETLVKANERVDDLNRGGYRVIQDPDAFCFGVDAVLLSWFARVAPGERVMDLCTGSGVVLFLMDARYPGGDLTGLELQPEMAEMAARSVRLNHAEDHIRIVEGDVRNAADRFGKGVFDAVTANPPYMKKGSGLLNPAEAKAVARHEISLTLPELIREAGALLKPGGRFYLVHRPGRLAEILSTMRAFDLAPSRLIPVHSYRDKEATLVLVEGIAGGRNEMKVLPPVVIYEKKQVYTEEFLRIHRE